MDLKRLRYFCTVVEQGQVSRAARLLHMAQPPLSQRLRELEEEFGYSLFERKGRTLRVSAAGQVLYRRARDILHAVDATRDEVIRVASQSGPTLRIGVSPTCRSYWLERFSAVRQNFPGQTLGVVVGDSSYLEQMLRAGKLDFALMQPPLAPDDLLVHPVAESGSVAVTARGLLPPQLASVTLAELAAHPLLLLRRSVGIGSYERLLQTLREHGLGAEVAAWCSDVDILLDLLAQGMAAIAVVPDSEATARGADLETRPIAVDLPGYQCAAVFRRDEHAELIERALACWPH